MDELKLNSVAGSCCRPRSIQALCSPLPNCLQKWEVASKDPRLKINSAVGRQHLSFTRVRRKRALQLKWWSSQNLKTENYTKAAAQQIWAWKDWCKKEQTRNIWESSTCVSLPLLCTTDPGRWHWAHETNWFPWPKDRGPPKIKDLRGKQKDKEKLVFQFPNAKTNVMCFSDPPLEPKRLDIYRNV